MYTSVRIKNLRCFTDFSICPLERINLITGKNNTGKTTLLEALFLLAGPNNPSLPLKVENLRGVEQFTIDAEGLWGWLFREKRLSRPIELAARMPDGGEECLTISIGDNEGAERLEPAPSSTGKGDAGVITTSSYPQSLILRFRSFDGREVTSRAFPAGDSVRHERGEYRPLPSGIYLSARARTSAEDPARFSRLEETGGTDEIVQILKIVEPRLRRLSLLVMGERPVICGDVGLTHLLPVQFMGEGFGRLLTIVLAIVSAPGGTVLIDEVDNGLHHSILTDVWRVIGDAARRLDVQITCTTHSRECVRAAHEAFEHEVSYDLRLHRLQWENGDVVAVTYDQETLDTAMVAELEVR